MLSTIFLTSTHTQHPFMADEVKKHFHILVSENGSTVQTSSLLVYYALHKITV